jgi:hypothetical protein
MKIGGIEPSIGPSDPSCPEGFEATELTADEASHVAPWKESTSTVDLSLGEHQTKPNVVIMEKSSQLISNFEKPAVKVLGDKDANTDQNKSSQGTTTVSNPAGTILSESNACGLQSHTAESKTSRASLIRKHLKGFKARRLSVKDLRTLASSQNLSQQGSKSILLERLAEHAARDDIKLVFSFPFTTHYLLSPTAVRE